MSALAEFNALKAEAKSYGIDVKGLKKVDLLPLVEAKRAELAASLTPCPLCNAKDKNKCPCDPFDEIDPETEGDHLTDDVIADSAERVTTAAGGNHNRESWLIEAVHLLTPMMAQVGAVYDPDKVRVSVGFGPRRKALGVCFPTQANNAGLSYVFISPVEDDVLKILATLVHELIHVSDDCKSGHQNHFAKCARALGLEGKLTATVAGEGLNHALADVAEKLGAYPHTKLNMSGAKKQKTYLLKMTCESCEFTYRTTQKQIDRYESFPCPCGEQMEIEVK